MTDSHISASGHVPLTVNYTTLCVSNILCVCRSWQCTRHKQLCSRQSTCLHPRRHWFAQSAQREATALLRTSCPRFWQTCLSRRSILWCSPRSCTQWPIYSRRCFHHSLTPIPVVGDLLLLGCAAVPCVCMYQVVTGDLSLIVASGACPCCYLFGGKIKKVPAVMGLNECRVSSS